MGGFWRYDAEDLPGTLLNLKFPAGSTYGQSIFAIAGRKIVYITAAAGIYMYRQV